MEIVACFRFVSNYKLCYAQNANGEYPFIHTGCAVYHSYGASPRPAIGSRPWLGVWRRRDVYGEVCEARTRENLLHRDNSCCDPLRANGASKHSSRLETHEISSLEGASVEALQRSKNGGSSKNCQI